MKPAQTYQGREITTRIIDGTAGLLRIEQDWWRLWRRCPTATPFQSPAWLIPWWQAFAPGPLATAAVFRSRELVALAPLYLERGHQPRFLPIGISLSDMHDVLLDAGDPELPDAVFGAIQDAAGRSGALRVDWPDVPPGAFLERLPISTGWCAVWANGGACPELELSAGLQSVPAAKRRKLRMAWHRAEARGVVEIRDAGDVGLEPWLDALFALHGARWRTRGEDGVLADETARAFQRRAVPALASAGLLDGRVLTIGGRIAGVYYGLTHGKRAYAYLGGFDPDFVRESPGTILMGDAIERAAARGCTSLNFLRGREAYKYEWGAIDRVSRALSLRRVADRDG